MKLAARVRRYLVLATLAAPVALLVHCGTTDDSLFDPNAGSACTGALAASCGAACAADEQCGAGTFCTGATCTAQCSVDAPCTDGLLCSPRGRCTPDGLDPAGGGTGFGGGGGGGGGSKDGAVSSDGGVFVPTGDACAAIDVTLAKVIPTIALLIDRSGSMSDPLGDAGTRWNVLREALIAPDGGLIKQLENDVRFGLALYTFSGSNNSASCPTITGQNLGFQLGNYGAIYNVYADAGVGSETPTGDSIDKLMGRVSDGGFTDAGFAALDAGGPQVHPPRHRRRARSLRALEPQQPRGATRSPTPRRSRRRSRPSTRACARTSWPWAATPASPTSARWPTRARASTSTAATPASTR
jgi:hypothetical protein